jgi:hypothetical protein
MSWLIAPENSIARPRQRAGGCRTAPRAASPHLSPGPSPGTTPTALRLAPLALPATDTPLKRSVTGLAAAAQDDHTAAAHDA